MGEETIVVVGAGVLGLSSALICQQHFPRTKVVIVARDLPGTESIDYASPWSGAHYRPIPDITPQGIYEASLARRTYDHFKIYAADNPDACISFTTGMDWLERPGDEYLTAKTRYQDIDEFRVLRPEELPSGVKWGASYKTWCVNTPVYLCHLLRRFILNGGRIVQKRLESLSEAFTIVENVRTVINCSGVGFNDPASFITRGQTCLVANTASQTVTRQNADGTWTFVIPRPAHGGTIIGGTKEERDYESSPRLETRQRLLEAAAKSFPDLLDEDGKFRVIRDIVGRRPSRTGGMRLEVEDFGMGRHVIHGYGAGGRGVEMSWGVAEEVLSLLRKWGAACSGPL
ncbi:nucleotide-binding domain-containing protein [Cadophora sp. DSE1049]|nr:nucleotide-binding domain-containing protein [Cadophora sp. DSE1049]